MGDKKFVTIDIKKYRELFSHSADMSLGDDFFITDVTVDDRLENFFRFPCRFDGFMALFCQKGGFNVDINLTTYSMKKNSLLLCMPGNIIGLSEGEDRDAIRGSRFVVVAMSSDFFGGLHFDFNRLYNDSFALLNNPCIELDGSDLHICEKYLDLAGEVISDLSVETSNKKDAVGSLITSVFYAMAGIWTKKVVEGTDVKSTAASARNRMLFENFIQLVKENHNSERNMSFYANKLCLTPKYLSKLIKEVSGRSAPDWIDSFVVLEAKNMLKYTDAPIKEIVYKLHFQNHSVFYKFFRSHTGMTPSEYRDS